MNWNPLRWLSRRSTLRQPAGWLLDALGCERTLSGMSVNAETALTISTVWSCVRVISEGVASLPQVPYEPIAPKGKNLLPAHPVARLMNREPNPEMTAISYRSAALAHAALWGNHYSEIERTRAGDVRHLWPLRPDMVTPVRSKGGALRYEVRSAEHPERAPVVLRPENVLHVPGLGFDGVVGYSVIRKARETMGLSLATEKFGAAWFGNGSRPGGFIQHPARLSPDAQANLRKSFEAIHAGVENSHRLAILEEGMTFNPMSVPPDDAQFLETRQFNVLEVCRWFRVPPHKVYELSRATFSNIEHQSIEFVNDSLYPWFVRFDQESNRKLFTEAEKARGLAVEHRADRLLMGDVESRYRAYAVGRQWGWLSADDVREAEGMNPLPGEQGDMYLAPMNMAPADMLDDVVQAQIASATQPAKQQNPNAPQQQARAIAAAHAPLIADALKRLSRVEVDKATRAAKKPETFAAWRDEFYGGHAEHVREVVRPPVRTLCDSVAAATGRPVGADVVDRLVSLLAALHVEDGRGMIPDADSAAGFATRAEAACGSLATAFVDVAAIQCGAPE